MNGPRFEDPFPTDPPLRELLEEIARRQEARLLRIPRGRSPRTMLVQVPRAQAIEAGLLLAERELLRLFREEMADLLRRIAFARLTTQPRMRRVASPYLTPNRRLLVPDEAILRRKLRGEGKRLRESFGDDLGAFELLDAIQSGSSSGSDAASAATASLRLVPNDSCRVFVAQELAVNGSIGAATRGFSDLLITSRRPEIRAIALSWQGLFAALRGDFRAALANNRFARELDQERPGYSYNCFAYAVQSGDRFEAALEARYCEDCGHQDSPALVDWLAAVYEQLAAGEWRPTSEGRALAHDLSDKSGPVARRIACLFLEGLPRGRYEYSLPGMDMPSAEIAVVGGTRSEHQARLP